MIPGPAGGPARYERGDFQHSPFVVFYDLT